MSNRERWIVYPLLFMVMLKSFLHDPLVKPNSFHCHTISCQQLLVNSVDGSPLVQITDADSQSGQIRLFGSQKHLAMLLHTDRVGKRGQLEIMDDGRAASAVIGTEKGGGYVQLNAVPPTHSIFLGHDGRRQVSGLLAKNDRGAVIAVEENGSLRPWGSSFPWKALEAATETGDRPASSTDVPPGEDEENAPAAD